MEKQKIDPADSNIRMLTRARYARWTNENQDKVKAYRKKRIDGLKDSYIRTLIAASKNTKVAEAKITQPQIEEYKAHIMRVRNDRYLKKALQYHG